MKQKTDEQIEEEEDGEEIEKTENRRSGKMIFERERTKNRKIKIKRIRIRIRRRRRGGGGRRRKTAQRKKTAQHGTALNTQLTWHYVGSR